MSLLWLLLVPALGGVLAWVSGARHPDWPRWIALLSCSRSTSSSRSTLIGPAVSSGQTVLDREASTGPGSPSSAFPSNSISTG